MSVPILTIPETAFDPRRYVTARTQNNLLKFLVKLLRGSSLFLVLAYLVGIFGLRPLMETTISQKLDFLQNCRGQLRDLYLNVIGRVKHIPIVAIHKEGASGKLYADAICQTDETTQKHDVVTDDALGMDSVGTGLHRLSEALERCAGFQTGQLPHYRVVEYCLKDFRQKIDLLYFNQRTLFSGATDNGTKQASKNMSQEVKTEIRGVKGLYMSGFA